MSCCKAVEFCMNAVVVEVPVDGCMGDKSVVLGLTATWSRAGVSSGRSSMGPRRRSLSGCGVTSSSAIGAEMPAVVSPYCGSDWIPLADRGGKGTEVRKGSGRCGFGRTR